MAWLCGVECAHVHAVEKKLEELEEEAEEEGEVRMPRLRCWAAMAVESDEGIRGTSEAAKGGGSREKKLELLLFLFH